MRPILLECLQVVHMNISQKLNTSLLQAYSFFISISIFLDILLSPLNISIYSCPVKVVLPPLHPRTQGILQFLVTGIMVSSQVFLKGSDKII